MCATTSLQHIFQIDDTTNLTHSAVCSIVRTNRFADAAAHAFMTCIMLVRTHNRLRSTRMHCPLHPSASEGRQAHISRTDYGVLQRRLCKCNETLAAAAAAAGEQNNFAMKRQLCTEF